MLQLIEGWNFPYYGPGASVGAACLALGFDEETCAAAGAQAVDAVEAYCVYATGGYTCEQAGIDPCSVLTNPDFSLGLCGTLAGALTTSDTCEEWADSFEDEFLSNSKVTSGKLREIERNNAWYRIKGGGAQINNRYVNFSYAGKDSQFIEVFFDKQND